jgi:hypothetical protein
MLEGSPDNSQSNESQKREDSVTPFKQLGFASSQSQILNSLSFEAIENAALPTLERVFELTLDWHKVNNAFNDLARAFLFNPSNEQLETQRRIVIAALNVTEELTASINLRTLPRINLLINSVELIIESLSAANTLLVVDEFSQLPLAYFALAEALHLMRSDSERLEDIQLRIVMGLAQRVVPDLAAVDGLTKSARNGLTSVVRVLMSQKDIYNDTMNPQAGVVSYWSDVLFLARESKSIYLQPVLLNVCEHLWDSSKRDLLLSDKNGSLKLLSDAVAALVVSGENQRSISLYKEILDHKDIRDKVELGKKLWYQAFLGLSMKSVSASWEYLRILVEDSLYGTAHAHEVLLDYLDLPGADVALRAELNAYPRKDLVISLAAFFCQEIISHDDDASEQIVDCKDNSLAQSAALRRKILGSVFSDFDWKL